MKLTRAGKNLLADAMANKVQITFTKGALGSGAFDYENESVLDVEELRQWEIDLPIESLTNNNDGTVNLVLHQTNAHISKGFFATEIGVFARGDDSDEILYSYINLGEEGSFVPSATGAVTKDLRIAVVTVISDAENVTAVLDESFLYAPKIDFDDHINSATPHKNAPTFYGDTISSGDYIWATSNDNNLHKLPINALREVTESAAVITTEELGLDGNITMIEDYKGGDKVTDDFKVRITSSAEMGLLVGIESAEGIRTGGVYVITDGIFGEEVIVESIINNAGGLHLRLKTALLYQYNYNNCFLYRTTPGSCDKKRLEYVPEKFAGIVANEVYVVGSR